MFGSIGVPEVMLLVVLGGVACGDGKPLAAFGEPGVQGTHPGGQNEDPLRGLNLGQGIDRRD
jgi:hypothetical protein